MATSGSARTVTCDPAWLTVWPPHSSRKSRCRHKAVLAPLASLTTSQPAFRPGNLSNLADPKHSRIPRDRIPTVHRLSSPAIPAAPSACRSWRGHAIQMFEDYAGTSSSGFRAEVESEQAIARGEDLLAMIDQHEHQQMTRPAAEAADRLASFVGHARFAGQVATDPRRLARLMARHDPAIYPGRYVTCIYSHAKALCTRSGGPDLGSCRPLECRNAAFTTANRDTLRGELASIDTSLTRTPALPPYLQHTLARRREAITAFLTGRPQVPE
jgi:hypothetical protein